MPVTGCIEYIYKKLLLKEIEKFALLSGLRE